MSSMPSCLLPYLSNIGLDSNDHFFKQFRYSVNIAKLCNCIVPGLVNLRSNGGKGVREDNDGWRVLRDKVFVPNNIRVPNDIVD